ncbi:MAG TPA: ABC transporter substrate-binding protein [Candidatus Methylomirabilis sp.]|nr:ABC transporter substrate-binding protein [Candidatus Methylomirabilis sp.]
MKRAIWASLAGALLLLCPPAQAAVVEEPPSLAGLVAAGKMPPMAERLPEHPLVIETDPEAVYGGDLRMLVGTPKDLKLASVYGYARLVRFDRQYRIVPDIAERVDVEGGRVFTFHLRKGHRWSDGAPFTSADFAYWWEYVAKNRELSPAGPPPQLMVDGEYPRVEFPDPWTVRYRWSKPNNLFLLDQASAAPTVLYRPAHYLKQFHIAFTNPEKLAKLAKAERRRSWASLHNARDSMYVMDNPDLPTLQPWRPTVSPPAEVFIAERNPYFHRVDQRGRQLPYIGRIKMVLVDRSVIPIKTSTGEADLQARYLSFDDYTFLKKNERLGRYHVLLWPTAATGVVVLYPNLTTSDAVMRKLLQDRRFRRALSLAIDREEINKTLYYGLGVVGQNTVLPGFGLGPKGELRMAYAQFDLAQANRLLDEMGLTRRDAKGYRLRPDGKRLDIILESSGESTEQTDVLELVKDTWSEIGIQLLTRPSQRTVYRRRVFSGEAMMSVGVGSGEFGLPTPDMSPSWLAPVSEEQLQWSQWGLYFESKGQRGEPPTLPAAQKLVELYRRWLVSTDEAERARIWGEMLVINADEVFTIGILGDTPQPVVVANRLRGVPEKAVYTWDPGAQFGYLSPDTFYWQGGRREPESMTKSK